MQTAFYDPDADIAVFRIADEPLVRGEKQSWGGVYGYDSAGDVVRVGVWFAANSLPEFLIAALPRPDPESN